MVGHNRAYDVGLLWKFPIVFFGNFQTNIDYQKPTFWGVFFYPFLSSSEPLVPPHGFGAAWQQ